MGASAFRTVVASIQQPMQKTMALEPPVLGASNGAPMVFRSIPETLADTGEVNMEAQTMYCCIFFDVITMIAFKFRSLALLL